MAKTDQERRKTIKMTDANEKEKKTVNRRTKFEYLKNN